MTNVPPEGFITRSEAAASYNRAQRTLERDLDAALRMRDEEVLVHYYMVTKDGEIRPGREVTLKQVKQLTTDGMNPTWYVEARWLEELYGRKGSPRPKRGPRTHKTDGSEFAAKSAPEPEPVSRPAYDTQLADRDEQIRFLKREIEIKNEQIAEANANIRKSNELMDQVQKMLDSWQKEAFKSLGHGARTAAAGSVVQSELVTTPVEIVSQSQPAEKQTSSKPASPKTARSKAGPRKQKGKSGSRAKSKKKPPPPKWYEFPTAKRIFLRK